MTTKTAIIKSAAVTQGPHANNIQPKKIQNIQPKNQNPMHARTHAHTHKLLVLGHKALTATPLLMNSIDMPRTHRDMPYFAIVYAKNEKKIKIE